MVEDVWSGSALPSVCPETAPFWDACNRSQFLVQRCRSCSKPQYHYRSFCSHCWSQDVEDVPIEGSGKIWSFSVVHRNNTPAFKSWGLYAVGLVELPEGVKVVTRIDAVDYDALAIGADVTIAFATADNGQMIPYFRAVQ
jgi:uncharacterized protein